MADDINMDELLANEFLARMHGVDCEVEAEFDESSMEAYVKITLGSSMRVFPCQQQGGLPIGYDSDVSRITRELSEEYDADIQVFTQWGETQKISSEGNYSTRRFNIGTDKP